ncbi:MAG: zf-HC2 domain-containing protein [Acidobacteriota bacterium]
MNCSQFEELMSDYIERSLDNATQRSAAAHALSCPLCHALLNEVKTALAVCREMSEPKMPITRLEAKILERTVPEAAMHCEEFEERLTDYLDGFLPAQVFHRWERHAVLCDDCTDLPGAVVRSLAACVSYKLEELPIPEGLHESILKATLGTIKAETARASAIKRFGEWARGFSFPISIPQLAPVAMMLLFAFLVFSQTVSADGSLTDVYTKGVELAEQTYKQSADAWGGRPQQQAGQDPVEGTTFVEDKK